MDDKPPSNKDKKPIQVSPKDAGAALKKLQDQYKENVEKARAARLQKEKDAAAEAAKTTELNIIPQEPIQRPSFLRRMWRKVTGSRK